MQQAKSKNSHLGLLIIVGTLAVLMLILMMVIGILFVASQFGSTQASQVNPLIGRNPLAQLNIEDIDPALALASLGGIPEADVVAEAVDKARPETALAGLLFSQKLTNKESAGGFLQLAAVYANSQVKEKAIFSYKQAGTIATLAPDIPDTARSDIFLQAGEGLITLDEPTLAKFYLDQAFVLAAKSPFLQAAHRRSILERLQKNYIIIDERTLARKSLGLSANAPSLTQTAIEQTVLPAGGPLSLPESIQQAEANRWRAAQELSVLLVDRGGKAPQDAVRALADALVAEDQQKLPFIEQGLAQTTQVSKKIDLTLAKIAWLSIKYRVARRAYGISLVPEWETQAEQIRADLTKTHERLYALYADMVIALPEISKIDRGTEEKLRSEVLAGELGRYPNYPEEQRRQQLLEASEQLINTQPEISIFVSVGELDNENAYTLISPQQEP